MRDNGHRREHSWGVGALLGTVCARMARGSLKMCSKVQRRSGCKHWGQLSRATSRLASGSVGLGAEWGSGASARLSARSKTLLAKLGVVLHKADLPPNHI